MMPIRIANALIIRYLKSYENYSADFLNYENFLRHHIKITRNESLCRRFSVFCKNRDLVVFLCVTLAVFGNRALAIGALNLTNCSLNRTSAVI